MWTIAIDLWDKRCWIAIEVEGISFSHSIVSRVSLVNELKKLFKNKVVGTIIVWLPYDLYWIEKKQLIKTKSFIWKLSNIFPDKKIIWIDERYTSFEAENILKALWENNFEWKKDDISAQLILETYLERAKNNDLT